TYVAVGLDRSLYIGDDFQGSIRRVTTDGVIDTVARGGTVTTLRSSPVRATNLFLINPRLRLFNLAISPLGTLYVSAGSIVFRVDTDGFARKVADFSPGFAFGIDFAPEGTLYATVQVNTGGTTHNTLVRIGTDGTLTTVVGP